MSERVYPDEPVGPFEEPPVSFEDAEDRRIEIRGGVPGDDMPEALVAMYTDFDASDRAQGIPPSDEAQIRRWLTDLYETGYNVMAWHGEDVAGHATLVPESDDEDPAPHELAIFVLQAYQRAGIGKRLLRALLGHAAANGIGRVWLTVEQWNQPAIGLYEDVGFEVADAQSFEREMSIKLD